MRYRKTTTVRGYVKMWPRTVFDIRRGTRLLDEVWDLLMDGGVYVLYRDEQPYYVGKASRLSSRIWAHANRSKDRYYNFWNYFSAFVVPDKRHRDEIEGVLIASMPTENSSSLRIRRIHLPADVARVIRKQRIIRIDEA